MTPSILRPEDKAHKDNALWQMPSSCFVCHTAQSNIWDFRHSNQKKLFLLKMPQHQRFNTKLISYHPIMGSEIFQRHEVKQEIESLTQTFKSFVAVHLHQNLEAFQDQQQQHINLSTWFSLCFRSLHRVVQTTQCARCSLCYTQLFFLTQKS